MLGMIKRYAKKHGTPVTTETSATTAIDLSDAKTYRKYDYKELQSFIKVIEKVMKSKIDSELEKASELVKELATAKKLADEAKAAKAKK